MNRAMLLIAIAALSAMLAPSPTTLAQTTTAPAPAVALPSIPDPVPVQLDASTTAFLAIDLIDPVCTDQPSCVASLPFVASELASARAANALVVYSSAPDAPSILNAVAPLPGDPIVTAFGDKFLNTNLDAILRGAGITTVVVAGTKASGAVLYTSFELTAHGYTVVVAQDAISAPTAFDLFIARYQLLNQPPFGNAQNVPLKPQAVTLSRTDLIVYVKT